MKFNFAATESTERKRLSRLCPGAGKQMSVAAPVSFSSPFKGEAGRGMGQVQAGPQTHPHPGPPLEGEGGDLTRPPSQTRDQL